MATLFQYANEVAKLVEGAKVVETEKANGVRKVGINVKIPNVNVAPTVYVEQFYDDGLSIQQAAAFIMRITNEHRPKEQDFSCFMDYTGYVKGHLRAGLYFKQTKASVFRDAKYLGFEDLIIVPYVVMQVNGEDGAVKVTKEHLKTWGVDEDEVIDTALKNTEQDVVVKDLFGMVEDMNNLFEAPFIPEMQKPLYVSNEERYLGAAAILGLIPKLKEKYTNGFYVLPSSIHEVLVMPNGEGASKEAFDMMVDDVSTNEIAPEDVLGYQAYAFGV